MFLQCLLIAVLFLSSVNAEIIEVPEEAPSIQSAFDVSQAGDTILLASQNYQETVIIPAGLRTLAGNFLFSGNPVDLETTVLSPADTVQADTACILLMMQPCTLRIIGLTFEFGRGVRRPNDRREGGAIYAVNSSLDIEDCKFQDCFADFGVCTWSTGCEVSIRRTHFERNGRINSPVFSQGCIRAVDGNLFVDSCRFSRNTVTGASAIITSEGTALIEHCVIDSNSNPSASLGAITSDNAHLTVRACQFKDNVHGQIFVGSCIMADSFAAIENCEFSRTNGSSVLSLFGDTSIVTHCTFDSNTALFHNPACIALGSGYNVINGCVFRNNTAPRWSTITTNSTTRIENCLFDSNIALDDSGAILNAGSDSILLDHCSFENNTPYAFSTDFWWFEGYIDARNCYWGAPTGPYQEILNPNGEGDAILGTDVLFDPWLQQSPLVAVERKSPLVREFDIKNVFPNPFNSSVTIEYTLTHEQEVKLEIYDVLGRQVEALLNGRKGIGVHTVRWSADGFPSGLYFARLSSAEGIARTVKLMLLK